MNLKRKILTHDDKIITIEEFFLEEQKGRKEMANLPFEEKIKILISLQQIAYKWGEKKDIIIWGSDENSRDQ